MNLTFIVQAAPGAKLAPVQVSTSPLKNQVKRPEPVPDATATEVTVTAALPGAAVFFSVTVPVPLPALPIGVVILIVSGFGVSETLEGGAPVPLSETGDPVTATLAPIVNAPLTGPVAVGLNTTLIVQLEVAAKVVRQVPPAAPAGREYCGEEKLGAIAVKVEPPVLFSVTVCAVLVEPVTTLPKASDVGVTLAAAGPATATYSTAPTSTKLFVLRSVP